jgi:hypothetical protein
MKRSFVAPTFVMSIGIVVCLMAALPAEAGKKYKESDLDGTYYYTTTQVREANPPFTGLEYCSGYGTVEFYGDGTSLIEGWDRCSNVGTRWNSEPHGYSVTPAGEVILWRSSDPVDTVHCQILDNGKMLMCDGVESTPDVLTFHAVAVKQ